MNLKDVLVQWVIDHKRDCKSKICEEVRTVEKFIEVLEE